MEKLYLMAPISSVGEWSYHMKELVIQLKVLNWSDGVYNSLLRIRSSASF